MKETGILFTPENYAKCENGMKTRTRRIICLPSAPNHLGQWAPTTIGGPHGGKMRNGEALTEQVAIWHTISAKVIACPYGTVGDRMYVKEGLEKTPIGYSIQYQRDHLPIPPPVMGGAYGWRWQRDTLSPLHMPKWAARLWLEITEVRVERVTSISREDAKAEGLWPGANGLEQAAGRSHGNAQLAFQALWKSIHGSGAWARNDWVWVLTFKKIQP